MEEKIINKIKVTLAAVFSMGMLVACDVPQPEQFTVYEAAITQDSYENYEDIYACLKDMIDEDTKVIVGE